MPPSTEIIAGIESAWKLMTGSALPSWILQIIGGILLVLGLLYVFGLIKKQWDEQIVPLFYKPEQKQARINRQRFAAHIQSEIQRLNRFEDWSDYRFTELEAEVEAEGKRKVFGIIPLIRRTRSGLRRERSLSKALESSQEQLILVEGEPGSGKSVALRHVAEVMAQKAKKSRRLTSVIPIHVNLKELSREETDVIDRNLIESFVLQSLKKINDRNIDEFLDKEFPRGLREGTWFFLFDSFDELPDIIGLSEANDTIRSYAEAIADFLGGMNQCRGIIASRHFRGPGQSGWPRFRILPLTERQRLQLIHKFHLGARKEQDFLGQLGTSASEIYALSENPMYLGLLCEYIKAGNAFPSNTHSIFEGHISTRFSRDEDKIKQRGLTIVELRDVAEQAAFCMAADQGLGLVPTRNRLEEVMRSMEFDVNENFHIILDTLEYVKIARSEMETSTNETKSFTFSHRRFQEYFATCVVLKEKRRVNQQELLMNSRWRETAVVMCQTQPISDLSPLIQHAIFILDSMQSRLRGLIKNPIEYIEEINKDTRTTRRTSNPSIQHSFPWPKGSLHLLALLQDGFSNRLNELPEQLKLSSSQLLLSASEKGTLIDRKWALEVAGIVHPSVLTQLLRSSFSQNSVWLWDIAYRQTARLKEMPKDIAAYIRYSLYQHMINRRLSRERYATEAHLKRLPLADHFISVSNFLRYIYPINSILHLFTIILFLLYTRPSFNSPGSMLLCSIPLLSYLLSTSSSKTFQSGLLKSNLPLFIIFIWTLHYIIPEQHSPSASIITYAFMDFFGAMSKLPDASMALAFYSSTWLYSSSFLAQCGIFLHPIFWLFSPVIAPYYFVKSSLLHSSLQHQDSKQGTDIKSFLTITLIIPAISILSALASESYPLVSKITSLIVNLYNLYLWTTILWVFLTPLYLSAVDFFRMRSWINERPDRISHQDLMKVVSRFKTGKYHILFTQYVRENEILAPSDDTIEFLKRFGSLLEYWSNSLENNLVATTTMSVQYEQVKVAYNNSLLHRKSRTNAETTIIPPQTADEWYQFIRPKHIYFRANWIPEWFDEVSKLLESVQTRCAPTSPDES